jgi:biotin carboxylase
MLKGVARVLLLLPTATYRAADFLTAARALSAEVVVASERRLVSLGDNQLTLDLRRPEAAAEAIAAVAQERPLDAVVAVDDQGVRVAALAATRLGLSGNPLEAAAATRDKAAMRRALAAAGVPQPEHRTVGPSQDPAAVAAEIGFPCVVKPLSLSASRGVIRADDPRTAAAAATRVRAILSEAGEDPGGTLLIERYVPGAEVAVEGLLRAGALEPLAIFDKPDALEGPYFEETIFTTPSRLPGEIVAAVTRTTADACAALGLREGPIHAELRVHGGHVWMLELAARSIGGLCSRSLRFGVGVSLEELILRHALGLPLGDLRREAAASGVMMLPIPRAGLLRKVRGQDDARAVPGIAGLEISIGHDRTVRPLPEGDRYLGFLFARGETPAQVEHALRAAHERLEIDIVEPSAGERSAGAITRG